MKKETKVKEETSKKVKAHTIYKHSDGKRVPGVTTIIGGNLGWKTRGLMYWAVNEVKKGNDPFKVRDQAADIGTITHALIEGHLTGEVMIDELEYAPKDFEKAEGAFMAYLEWENKHEPVVVATEVPLVSDEYRYGGTLDLVAKIDGVLTLVDFKTSKAMYPDHIIQLAAYQELWRETHDGEVLAPSLLRISKDDGSIDYHSPDRFTKIDKAFECFIACLTLHILKKEVK